jgi:hypothetical protein
MARMTARTGTSRHSTVPAARTLLVTGPQTRVLEQRPAMAPVGFSALTPGLLDRVQPAAVAFALFSPVQDAFQVLGRLERLGFRGRVLALAPPLPARRMVERELQAQAPMLRVRVLCLPVLAAP